MSYDLLEAACAFADAGCCVIPTKTDGTKAPAVVWKKQQAQVSTPEQLANWFSGDSYEGFGIICGAISGNLEMLEFEGRAVHLFGDWLQALADNELTGLRDRLTRGYLERTPSGGLHLLYRVADAPASRNVKLAKRPSTDAELALWRAEQQQRVDAETEPLTRQKRQEALDRIVRGEQVPKVMIETRGEGGYVVVAPSGGRTHDNGEPWQLIAGGPASIPVITAEERDVLYQLAQAFDEMPDQTPQDAAHRTPVSQGDNDREMSGGSRRLGDIQPGDDLRPGDDYNLRADWTEILEPYGWRKIRNTFAGPGQSWQRPGKDLGCSATTGTADDGDRLFVFSTSTEFESEKPYSKFAAYTVLNHGGDFAAATRELRRSGYGSPLPAGSAPSDTLTLEGVPSPDGAGSEVAATASQPPPDAVGASGEDPPNGVGAAPSAGAPSGSYSRTDDGNATRLVDAYSNDIRFCPQRGLWLTWDGHRWLWDEAEKVRERARLIARGLPAATGEDVTWKRKSLNNERIGAMVRMARTDERVVAHLNTLDAHPYKLNTPSGIVDLRTGLVAPPDPAEMHTRSTAVAPDWDLPAPRWQQFLADTFAGDPALTTYVQRLLGVSLIGEVLEQVLPFAYGVSGNNGKTTLLNVTQRLVGMGESGYAISAPAEVLLATRNTDHPATLAQFSGARLVVTSELEEGQRFAESKVKLLTGSDAINARFMAKNPFSFRPTHTLWLLANSRPEVRAGGTAFWRRIRLLPFLHKVPDERIDPMLEDRLVNDEGPAVLAWLIDGARDYMQQGLVMPTSVTEATTAYQLDQDTVTRFVTDDCEVGAHTDVLYRTPVKTIRAAYEAWCHYEGEDEVNPKAFTQELRRLFGVYSERSASVRFYGGLRLKASEPDGVHPEPADDADRYWGNS